MDNTNTNWPNNPSPTPTNGTPPPSMPDYTSSVPPVPQNPAAPVSPWPTPPPLPSSPMSASQPMPTSFDASANPAWTPTSTPDPLPANTNSAFSNPSPATTWPAAPSAPVEPTPPLTNPQPSIPSSDPGGNLAMNSSTAISTSPLDNPWGAPIQAPPIDGPDQNSQPTWTSPPMSTTNDATVNPLPSSMDNTMPINDSIPTDLSHLIGNNSPITPNSTGTENPPASPAETLVVPPTSSAPETPTVPAQAHQGIPKWLIGVGIGLLIMVAGASAYFILGVGQSPKTTSIPAEVTSKQTVKTPPPIATPPQASPAAVATDSANFGQLQGSGTTSPQASSAAELLKQRQQAQ